MFFIKSSGNNALIDRPVCFLGLLQIFLALRLCDVLRHQPPTKRVMNHYRHTRISWSSSCTGNKSDARIHPSSLFQVALVLRSPISFIDMIAGIKIQYRMGIFDTKKTQKRREFFRKRIRKHLVFLFWNDYTLNYHGRKKLEK